VHGEHKLDALFALAFIAGEALFILRRCAIAIRSKTNPLRSRRDYLYLNWDALLYRVGLELGLIYWPMRHYRTVEAWTGNRVHVTVPQFWIVFFLLGIFADALLDWFFTLDRVPIFGWPIPAWLKEDLPALALTLSDGTMLVLPNKAGLPAAVDGKTGEVAETIAAAAVGARGVAGEAK
jgi:hypothetical protein